MAIKSGHELIVKKADTPTTFRLAGIVPIKGEPSTEAVGRLNQTNYLRQQIPVGSKVRIVTDGADVHVFRAGWSMGESRGCRGRFRDRLPHARRVV